MKKLYWILLSAGCLMGGTAIGSLFYNRKRISELNAGSRVVKTPCGLVEYAEAGNGYPILSFHGTPGGYDGAILAAQLHCPPEYKVIGFSRPGYLRTPLASGQSAEAQAALARALLDALGLEQAIVYALSGGGPSAVAFAIAYPGRCRALILAAAVTQSEEPTKPSWQRPLEAFCLRASDCISWILPTLLPGSLVGRIARVLTPFAVRQDGYLNDSRMFSALHPMKLETIRVPVLIVHGMKDASVPFATAKSASRLIPQCRYLFVKDAGHASLLTLVQVQKTISAFVREMTPP